MSQCKIFRFKKKVINLKKINLCHITLKMINKFKHKCLKGDKISTEIIILK